MNTGAGELGGGVGSCGGVWGAGGSWATFTVKCLNWTKLLRLLRLHFIQLRLAIKNQQFWVTEIQNPNAQNCSFIKADTDISLFSAFLWTLHIDIFTAFQPAQEISITLPWLSLAQPSQGIIKKSGMSFLINIQNHSLRKTYIANL